MTARRLSASGGACSHRTVRSRVAMPLLIGVGLTCVCACGAGPSTGTESGNPINPPTPPAEHESVASALPPLDEMPDLVSDEPAVIDEPVIDDPALQPVDPVPPEPTTNDQPDFQTPVPEPGGGEPVPSTDFPSPIGSSDGEPMGATGQGPIPTPPASTAPEMTPSDGPGTAGTAGPTGAAGDNCYDDLCSDMARAVADGLNATVVPDAYQGECSTGSSAQDLCTCRSPLGDLALSSAVACPVTSPLGHCLYAGDEFSGCAIQADSCQLACDEVLERQRSDQATLQQVRVRAAACSPQQQCVFVLEAGQACWLGPAMSEVDCDASDDELIAGTAGVTP